MNFAPLRRVGFWWSEKKCKKLNVKELTEVFRASGLELVKLDLERPLEEQGPFSAIVHKMSNFLVEVKSGDSHAKAICDAFQRYVDTHPTMAVIDALQDIEKVLDRYQQYKLVEQSSLSEEGDIFIPPFVELIETDISENLTKMKAAGVDFPVVCKPVMAHGPSRNHQMSIVFNEAGLNDITRPCVVQKIINHNAVLYKLFVIGNQYFVTERPSLKNFYAGDHKTIYFESNDISKPNTASELTELEENEFYVPVVWPAKEKIDTIVQVIQEYSRLSLLGIDVIIDNKTGHYAIIDINVFPGYSEAHNFYNLLADLVLRRIHLKEAGLTEELHYPVLLEDISTPSLRVKDGKRDSSPDDLLSHQCDCFSECLHPNILNSKSSLEPKMHKCQHVAKDDDLAFNKHNGAQEDSGVETSDSCDEKKKKPCHKTLKHQHSKASDCPQLL